MGKTLKTTDIKDLDRHELRDLLQKIQEEILLYVREGRKNFNSAMKLDKKKEEIERRLSEMEDWGKNKVKSRSVSLRRDS